MQNIYGTHHYQTRKSPAVSETSNQTNLGADVSSNLQCEVYSESMQSPPDGSQNQMMEESINFSVEDCLRQLFPGVEIEDIHQAAENRGDQDMVITNNSFTAADTNDVCMHVTVRNNNGEISDNYCSYDLYGSNDFVNDPCANINYSVDNNNNNFMLYSNSGSNCSNPFDTHSTGFQQGGGKRKASDDIAPVSKRTTLENTSEARNNQNIPINHPVPPHDNITSLDESSFSTKYYTIKKIHEVNIKKFSTKGLDYSVHFNDLSKEKNPIPILHQVIDDVLDRVIGPVPAQDRIRIVLTSPNLEKPISLPFKARDKLDANEFLQHVESVIQSNESFELDDDVNLNVIHVALPEGGHFYKRNRCFALSKYLRKKKGVIKITNDDQMCMARCLVIAHAKITDHPKLNTIRRGGRLQEQLALNLHRQAGVPIGFPCGIEEAKRFQAVLTNMKIHIVSQDYFNGIIFSGDVDSENDVYLYHHQQHFDLITSMTAFLSRNYFCKTCKVGYDHIETHRCTKKCHLCFIGDCTVKDDQPSWVFCQDCSRYFFNEQCFQNHKRERGTGKKSICTEFFKCSRCNKVINRSRRNASDHNCGEIKCKNCEEFVDPETHRCYMQPARRGTNENNNVDNNDNDIEEGFWSGLVDEAESANMEQEEEKKHKFIFFDIETVRKVQQLSRNQYTLEPNLIVAQLCCEDCKEDQDLDSTSFCNNCGYKEKVFSGSSSLDEFCQFLFHESNVNSTIIAHNFSGFDGQFILKYCYANAIIPQIILSGAKIMSIQLDSYDMKFLDSFNFIPMALSKLPAALGLEGEIQKGFFPHFWNRPENQCYRGPLPPPEMYGYNDMKSVKDQENFMTWYNRLQSQNYVFDFQHEIIKYCKSDVDILRRSCVKFRDDFIATTELDPFASCLTIASACNLVFRAKYLEPHTIAVIPPNGYQPQKKYSIKALKWLMYLSHKEGVHIQHARNGGEHRVGKYFLDGFISNPNTDSNTNSNTINQTQSIAIDFHGCLFHGCPKCFSPETENPINKKTMQELYEATLLRKRFLEREGYTVQELWECEYEALLKSDPEMKAYIDSLTIQSPLDPRQSFFGGRTNATCLYYEAKAGEKIKYVDFCSLYPWVNKYREYPLFHPEIITQDFEDVHNYFGLIKCDVLPPKGLFHGVLPVKSNNKLMFPLCRKCSETLQQEPCEHTSEERMLKGTWVTLEVQTAIEKGYVVSNINDVWHYLQKTNSLFSEFIKTFQKLKQEASGWPASCDTEEKKLQYVEDYFEKEGVRLVFTNVMKNPGLRALAKLMLNSFWGKFGQRLNLTKVAMIKDPKQLFDLLTNDKFEVSDILPINEEVLEVHYKEQDEFVEASGRTNVVIAAFTTAHARLKLYSVLEQLEKRVLYFDTDSIIYVSREGEFDPPLGPFLGDLTDELDGHHITTFVSGGPKNYAYQLEDGSSSMKVRGITLNCRSTQIVNFETLKHMVRNFNPLQEGESVQVYEPSKIVRDRLNKDIICKPMTKDYRVIYDKRVIRSDYVTFPYGY